MKQMKIGYFADGPWAHRAFELLIVDTRFRIQFICVRYDSGDIVLEKYARNHGIDLLRHRRVSSKDFLVSVEKYDCDIFVSMSFNQIFTTNFIKATPLRTINCHAGLLPFYRGRNVLNWVLINDEKEWGITVHYVDEGIDTGDIILQTRFRITDEDDYSTLLVKAQEECASILVEALVLLYLGEATRTYQKTIHPVGLYCVQRKMGDERLNWNQSSRSVFNFVRAICPPGPSARSLLKGEEMQIHRVSLIQNAPAYNLIPGAVIGRTSNSIIVKTFDTCISIENYTYTGIIRIGDRFT